MTGLDRLLGIARAGVRNVGRDLGPGGDWAEVLLWLDRERRPWHALAPSGDTDLRVATMAALLRKSGATAVAHVASAWTCELEGGAEERQVAVERAQREGVAALPGRFEAVTLDGYERTGRFALELARITRDKRGVPSLGPWEDWTNKGVPAGRYPERLMRAIAAQG